ncbi:MAG: YfiR family protein [Nitrospirota bacterium]
MKKHFLIFLCGILLSAHYAGAQETGPTESQIKAAFLYNFVKFIDWPDNANTLTLCILGEDRFGKDIDSIEGKAAAGKALSVRRIKSVQDIKQCRMLFIASSENERLSGILTAAQGLNIITVGDTAGYAERGVIINFYMEQNKVRFEINKDAAARSGLKISSKLFSLARIVYDTPTNKGY